MATVTTGVGLISGLNFRDIVDQLMAVEAQSVTRLQSREDQFKTTQAAVKTLSANLLTLTTSATQLASAKTFETQRVVNSDDKQLQVTTTTGATVGNHQFQTVRLASARQLISRGFVNADQQTLSAGKITISSGGRAGSDTALSTLNGGAGVRRGTIRITDRSGAAADVDLSGAATVTDVLDAINSATGVSVVARVEGDRFVVTDTTGQTATNLTIADRPGGHTAADLGIGKSVASGLLSGNDVYGATGQFTLASLNDGNSVHLAGNQADIRITLTDPPASTLDIDLNGAFTLDDVVARINSHVGNAGKLTAAVNNGRLVLTDNTGGGGPNALAVTDINGAFATRTLGLDSAASGNSLSGHRLVAGLNSVLLRNLRGGQGIDQPGSIALTDRTGTTATIDLSQAESLDDVLVAINGAQDGSNVKLQLAASLNAAGNGITVRDTSGAGGNLIIADVAAGTLASQLGIAVNAAQDSVTSGTLNRRYVNEATLLSSYAPGGKEVRRGVIAIKDSTGTESTVNISTAVKSVGEVIHAIESATSGKVTVQLNDTGDGFVLIDQAGGSGQLQVRELGGAAAADLRILGTGAPGGDGKSRITSRTATVIDVAATDTLNSLRDKINAAQAGLQATVVDDGTALNPKRLLVNSSISGSSGRFILDDGGLGLGLEVRTEGQDALLRVGADSASAFLLSSANNHFTDVAPGLDVDLLKVGDQPASVDVVRDTAKVVDAIKSFANGYNDAVKKLRELTRFDVEGNTRGILQGTGIALRLSSTLGDLVAGEGFGPKENSVQSFKDMGITLSDDGTLQFDSFGVSIKVAQNLDGISKFFLDAQAGFAAKLKETVESYTDPLTGKLTTETNSLQDSVDTVERRIATLNAILETRRERLLNQFIKLEAVLSTLQSQQSALGRIQNLSATSSSSSSK